MLSASEIIDRLGGTSAVANALDVTPSVVSSWRTNKGGIPRWWQADLIALPVVDKRKPVRLCDFPKRERTRRAAAPQSAAA